MQLFKMCEKIVFTCPVKHCVKSVRVRDYSGSHFLAFELNTERYSVSLRIQSACGKIRTRITSNTGTGKTGVFFAHFKQLHGTGKLTGITYL